MRCCSCAWDRDLSAPPSSPADGDAYLVKAAATGAWTGQDGRIAYALAGGWRFCAPFAGLSAYVADEHKLAFHDGSAWGEFSAVVPLQNLPLLGINASADTSNRLTVKSAALLFDNAGAGVQAKVNKHASGDTASLLYQTGYSGRAEMGLAGDDDFPHQDIARRFSLARGAGAEGRQRQGRHQHRRARRTDGTACGWRGDGRLADLVG